MLLFKCSTGYVDLKVWSCKGVGVLRFGWRRQLVLLARCLREKAKRRRNDDGTAVSRWNTGEIRCTSNSNRPVLQQPFFSAFNFLFKEQLLWFRLRHSRPIWDGSVHCFDFETGIDLHLVLFGGTRRWQWITRSPFCDMRRIEPFPLCHHSLLDGLHLLGSSQFMPWSLLIVLEDQSMNHHESFIQSGDFYLRTVHVEAFPQMPRPKFVESPKRTVLGWNTFSLVFCRCFAVVSNFWAPRPRGFEIVLCQIIPTYF